MNSAQRDKGVGADDEQTTTTLYEVYLASERGEWLDARLVAKLASFLSEMLPIESYEDQKAFLTGMSRPFTYKHLPTPLI